MGWKRVFSSSSRGTAISGRFFTVDGSASAKRAAGPRTASLAPPTWMFIGTSTGSQSAPTVRPPMVTLAPPTLRDEQRRAVEVEVRVHGRHVLRLIVHDAGAADAERRGRSAGNEIDALALGFAGSDLDVKIEAHVAGSPGLRRSEAS